MKYEAILNQIYWDAPLKKVLICDRETLQDKEEEFTLECRFLQTYVDEEMHFKWSLASGNVYSTTVEGGWEKTDPDKLEVKQVVETVSSFLLVCEGILSKDCTPWMPDPDRSRHFIRIDFQRFNVIMEKSDYLGDRIYDLNRRYWKLEVGEVEMVNN